MENDVGLWKNKDTKNIANFLRLNLLCPQSAFRIQFNHFTLVFVILHNMQCTQTQTHSNGNMEMQMATQMCCGIKQMNPYLVCVCKCKCATFLITFIHIDRKFPHWNSLQSTCTHTQIINNKKLNPKRIHHTIISSL